ncbi:hypothetical protein CDA63_01015 [Hymenobacter amundsenii]|uniref:DUF3078 domain-containing protein n=1 Tax=Hymenobacter amundsenii TaxID=2006685 RepID=A0A246FQK2_9BACT|nr:DUF3078 domain-containing protein [Hymenobacter amundsenii]OWP64969.1 hypothetical protein CDA63_01015 [Hymenobacter amundsenii]
MASTLTSQSNRPTWFNLLLTVLLLGGLALPGRAQDEGTPIVKPYKVPIKVDTLRGWHYGGAASLNVSQISLSNWPAGGQSSLSGLAIGNSFAHFRNRNHTFDGALDVVYGLVSEGGGRLRKSDDRLEINGRYARQYAPGWSYAGQLNFKSQFSTTRSIDQPDSIASGFLAPAFVLASVGWEYRPNEHFSVLLSPLTGKFTIVRNQRLADAGAFGVQEGRRDAAGRIVPGTGQQFRAEMGSYVNVRYRQTVFRNIEYQTRLELFNNYFHKPLNTDVNWVNLLDFSVNDWVSANIATVLIYDDDTPVPIKGGAEGARGRRIQFKETLGIGLTYKF